MEGQDTRRIPKTPSVAAPKKSVKDLDMPSISSTKNQFCPEPTRTIHARVTWYTTTKSNALTQ